MMKNDKKFWDRGARFYTSFMKKNNSAYIAFSNLLTPYFNKEQKVLEVGCGTGQISFLINNMVDHLEATDSHL